MKQADFEVSSQLYPQSSYSHNCCEMNSAFHNQSLDFYVTGGTMMPDAVSYLERQADRDLYGSLLEGRYCYVLTARQMGKSSLTVRTAMKLRQAGMGAVVVDLAAIGRNLTIEQWYGSVLCWIGRGIGLSEGELEDFWRSRLLLSPVQRWMCALREIILPRYQGQLAIFVDEVDYVLDLPFPMDEFFAAVRECYNLRAEDAEMRRLTFCLVGVATPSDLIRNKRTTPFNIGQRIELHDFTAAEAEPLACGLRRDEKSSAALLKRVLYWTNGHPFLTQRLCRTIADDADVVDEGDVDRLCNDLFFTHQAQELDDNILFVRESLLRDEKERAALLNLYAKVRNGKRVVNDGTNALVDTLRLSGITRTEGNYLKVRNRIYERVFDRAWVERSMPDAELRRLRAAYRRGLWRAGLVSGVILFLIVALAVNEGKRRKAAQEAAQVAREAAQRFLTLSYESQIKKAQAALEEAKVGRVEELLRLYTPKVGEPDIRGFEWHYLWQSSHQEIQTLKLEHPVVALQIMPDGERIAIGQMSQTWKYRIEILPFDETGKAESFLTQSRGSFNKVIFTPDAQNVLVDGNEMTAGLATLFDTKSGRILAIFRGHRQFISAMSMSRDGQRLVTGDREGRLQFWELAKEPKSRIPETQRRLITWVDLSRDGRRVVSATGTDYVKIWDFATGRELLTLKDKERVFTAAAFFPDGAQLLTATSDGAMQVWNIRTRTITTRLTGHSSRITAIVFSPDGAKLATGSHDRTARLWDLAGGRELVSIRGHSSSVSAICWSSDGKRLATGSYDKYVKIWDVEKIGVVANGPLVASYLASAFSGDGQPLALAKTADMKVKVLRVPSGEELSTLDISAKDFQFAVFSPDAERVATCGSGPLVTIWDVRSGKRILSLAAKIDYVYTVAFSPDGKQLALVYDDRTVKFWDTTTGQELSSLKADILCRLSYRIAFSPDGTSIAAACANGDIILWNINSGRSVVFGRDNSTVSTMAFSRDGSNLVTGGWETTVKLWDVKTRKKLMDLGQVDLLYCGATFSPDGKRLITGSTEGTVKIWDVLTGQELMTLHKMEKASLVTSITFSSDGRSLITSSLSGSIKVWRLNQYREQ
jgi:WD40 repeat protein